MKAFRVVSRPRHWYLLLAVCGLVAAAPPKVSRALPELNQKVLDYSREHLGTKVGDGICATLAVEALGHAGATRYPLRADEGELAWGTEIKELKDVLPGDVVQLQGAVFKGRTPLPRGGTRFWSNTYPRHTAIVAGVKDKGKLIAILHQNVGPEAADLSVKQKVQEGTLRMDALQPGGVVRFYRPVPARSLRPTGAGAALVVVQGEFPADLGSGWSWIREELVAWRVDKGVLLVQPKRAAPRTERSGAEAHLVRALPRPGHEVYSVEVTLESGPSGSPESAGLVCVVGDKREIVLAKRAESGRDPHVRLLDRAASDRDTPRLTAACDSSKVRLRLLISGDAIIGQYRVEADEWWETLGRYAIPKGVDLSVGIIARFGPGNERREVRFSEPRIIRMASTRVDE
jgi:hypothetical protein